jgi:hypothetical protein
VTELLAKAKGHGEDNRDLKMDHDAQQLSQEQIEEMKLSGQVMNAVFSPFCSLAIFIVSE